MGIVDAIRDDIIGEGRLIKTPFGEKPLIYTDYTASGRAMESIERFIHDAVLPWYANTHSESSFTGRQTNALREEARAIIKQAVHASPNHALIFCGSGATSAICKAITLLDLDAQPAVVFIGPYEHHSNELPWRESSARVVRIPLDADGRIDQPALEQALIRHADCPLKVGAFSAASNVTGIRSDVRGISALLHQHGAYALWDYAAAAPYVPIDMTADGCDGIFLSPHKFPGGPGTPGILVLDRKLIRTATPAVPGGGTVSFVAPDRHTYVSNLERREEGGTPAIIESIRAGLVFRARESVGIHEIERREAAHLARALHAWRSEPNITLLGDTDAPRLSIVSMRIGNPEKPLHYAYVVALLNDLFGIQARGGCSCAGPYAHTLLNIDAQQSRNLEAAVQAGRMLDRPGWVRLNFNYFLTAECVDYIVRAVTLIARHGEALLGRYTCCTASGTWKHQQAITALPVRLSDYHAGCSTREHAKADTISFDALIEQAQIALTPTDG